MATIRREIDIHAPLEDVWDAVRDFGAVHERVAPGFLTALEMDGDRDRIVTFANGMVARERLIGIDDDAHRMSYAIIGDQLGHHSASIEVRAAEGRTRFVWVTDVLPELKGTAYEDTTVRHLLDMRVGIKFDENYSATSGAIVEYRKSTGWNPLGPGETPSDLHSFYARLKDREGPHGGRFHYVSPNTDLLGWVIERAAGRPYAELMSELLWKPVGAERSAY